MAIGKKRKCHRADQPDQLYRRGARSDFEMIRLRPICGLLLLLFPLLLASETPASLNDRLWRHRNLGKAYYENPVTQLKAPEEFRQALALAPNSVRDRINLGLALLRTGDTQAAITEFKKAQQADPTIPHTWFNLGILYKKQQENELAIEQLEGMRKLVPEEPVTHYNLGILYKLGGKADMALREFEAASRLDPTFAAPRFQLYNAYHELGRKEDSARELELFNEIKRRKAGAAVPEDPEWSRYSEIYDVVELDGDFDHSATAPSYKFDDKKIAEGVDAASAGMAVLDFDGDGRPDLIVWSQSGVILFKNGVTPVANSGLENLKEVVTIAPGDFDNDGLPDLAVVTRSGATLYVNHNGRFEPSQIKLPSGTFNKAIWIDYDHDYDLDLVLLGSKSMLLRNEGHSGFSDQTAHFPFTNGTATDGAVFDLVADNNETDLAVTYDDGAVVVYHDRHLGNFEAQPLPQKLTGRVSVQSLDVNNDGWTDLVLSSSSSVHLLLNDRGKLAESAGLPVGGPMMLVDIANRGLADIITGNTIYRNLGSGKFEPAHVEPLATGVA